MSSSISSLTKEDLERRERREKATRITQLKLRIGKELADQYTPVVAKALVEHASSFGIYGEVKTEISTKGVTWLLKPLFKDQEGIQVLVEGNIYLSSDNGLQVKNFYKEIVLRDSESEQSDLESELKLAVKLRRETGWETKYQPSQWNSFHWPTEEDIRYFTKKYPCLYFARGQRGTGYIRYVRVRKHRFQFWKH